MSATVQQAGLTIDQQLYDFVNQQALPGTGLQAEAFWQGFADLVNELTPINKSLLTKRDTLQLQIDAFHKQQGQWDAEAYKSFLTEIGYLVPEPEKATITTEHVEPEIALTAAPQLVVPVSNARFALNAANARWGSLYDALYGTDALSEDDGATRSGGYNPARGAKVIAFVRNILNEAVPLASASWDDVTGLSVVDGGLQITVVGLLMIVCYCIATGTDSTTGGTGGASMIIKVLYGAPGKEKTTTVLSLKISSVEYFAQSPSSRLMNVACGTF